MNFDYFEAESHASTYSKFRPSPPESLIEKIVDFSKEKIEGQLKLAVDVGCGSGQTTELLGKYFDKVIGLDPSSSIIDEAKQKCIYPNVSYRQSSAENIDLADGSVDLITVCQAIHWFDLPQFYKEAARILRENGVLAVIGYSLPAPEFRDKSTELAAVVKKYYSEVLENYIFPQSREVYLEHYSHPKFNEVSFAKGKQMKRQEGFVTLLDAKIEDITGYISSWSGFQNFRKQKGNEEAQEMLKRIEGDLCAILGKELLASNELKFKFEYFLLLGRKA